MGSRLRLVASIKEFTSLSRGVGADVAKWRGGRKRKDVKIELRVRMLVGSKRDDMVIVKVIMPYILTLHISDPDSHPLYPSQFTATL